VEHIKETSWTVLRLQRNVANPGRKDRRDRYDWRKQPVFDEGSEFVVIRREHREDDIIGDSMLKYEVDVFRLANANHPSLYEVTLLCEPEGQKRQIERAKETNGHALQAQAIMQNSVVVEKKTVRHWLVAVAAYPGVLRNVVQMLIDDGRLSLADLDTLAERTIDAE